MFRQPTIILILAALGLASGTARAAFEDVSVSPRSRAMGETGVAVPTGPYATALNPAHLAGIGQNGLAASYVRPFGLDFTDHYFLGAAVLGGPGGNFGLSLNQFKVNYQDVTLERESVVSFAYAKTLFSDMHSTVDAGFSVNYYHLEFGESIDGLDPGNDSSLGLDVGLSVLVHERTRLGVLAHNINNPQIGLDEEEIPQRLVAGVSYEPYAGVLTTFQFNNVPGEDAQYRGGLEMMLAQGFSLRAGIVSRPSKVTAGFGYGFNGFSLDYGYSSGGGTLESTHQFGVRIAWGGEAQ